MKKALITGITGQDGSYLAELLLDKGYEVHGLVRRSSMLARSRIDHLHANDRLSLHYGDLTDGVSLVNLVREIQPDEVYNLGAMSHVACLVRDAGLHGLDQRHRDAPPAGGDPSGATRLPLLPGIDLGDVRPDAAPAGRGVEVPSRGRRTAPPSCRRTG